MGQTQKDNLDNEIAEIKTLLIEQKDRNRELEKSIKDLIHEQNVNSKRQTIFTLIGIYLAVATIVFVTLLIA